MKTYLCQRHTRRDQFGVEFYQYSLVAECESFGHASDMRMLFKLVGDTRDLAILYEGNGPIYADENCRKTIN